MLSTPHHTRAHICEQTAWLFQSPHSSKWRKCRGGRSLGSQLRLPHSSLSQCCPENRWAAFWPEVEILGHSLPFEPSHCSWIVCKELSTGDKEAKTLFLSVKLDETCASDWACEVWPSVCQQLHVIFAIACPFLYLMWKACAFTKSTLPSPVSEPSPWRGHGTAL